VGITLNVALYYPWLYLKSGGERTVSEILRRSRHNWTIITNRYEADSTFDALRAANIVELPRVSVKRSFHHVALAGWRLLRQKLDLTDQDALVVFCEGIGDLVVFRNHDIPVTCFCLTPLRAAFDSSYQMEYLKMHRNQWHRRFALSIGAAAFRVVDRRAWKHYAHVFAISNEVKRRIVDGNLCPAEKVSMIYPGIDLSQLNPSGVYEKNFLLCSRIMWTKNIELGIDAFLDLQARRADLHDFTLTIAGFVDQKSRPYIARLRERAAGCPQVKFVESPSDQELFGLYQACYAVLYTPLNEDWGLVPLEGMALEKPVVAVKRGGPRETILDGETGFLVDPEPKAFSAAMETLADDPLRVRRMGKAGRNHVQRYEWTHFCTTLDEYLDRVAKASPEVGASSRRPEPLESL
jgi:glycosyltransferase involved in cell wall biosynthesis